MMLLAEHLELKDIWISLNSIANRVEAKIELMIMDNCQNLQDEKLITEKFNEYSNAHLIDSDFLNKESPEDRRHDVLLL